jgi:hypothetical protein
MCATYEIKDKRRLKHLPDFSKNPAGHRFLGSTTSNGLFSFVSFCVLELMVAVVVVATGS